MSDKPLFPNLEKDIATICQTERILCSKRVKIAMLKSGLILKDGKFWQYIIEACLNENYTGDEEDD